MVNKYVKVLEGREINTRTGEIWNIADVPSLWEKKVRAQIDKDGYYIDEDGTVWKKEINS